VRLQRGAGALGGGDALDVTATPDAEAIVAAAPTASTTSRESAATTAPNGATPDLNPSPRSPTLTLDCPSIQSIIQTLTLTLTQPSPSL
jgi:hypothetical protein